MAILTLGIDVSKKNLDIFDSHSKKHRQFPNTAGGIDKMAQQIYSFKANDADNSQAVLCSDEQVPDQQASTRQAIIESTGVYHRLVHQKLEEVGFKVCIVNPYKTRCFAKSAGFLAKTDKVDAKMLCAYGQKVECLATPYGSSSKKELESLVHYRDALQEDRKRLINQKEMNPASTIVKDLIIKQTEEVEQYIKQIEKRIAELLKTDKDFQKKAKILESTPGVGRGTTAALLCYLPELGSLNRKQVAALVGVAPMVCDSGTMRGHAMIKGGRGKLRKALYMPILTCIVYNPILKAFYQNLIQKGKPAKVALIAVMRKLVVMLNVMIKNNLLWTDERGEKK